MLTSDGFLNAYCAMCYCSFPRSNEENGRACVIGLTRAGKEYTLKDAGIDRDTDLGLVWIGEIGNEIPPKTNGKTADI